MEMTPLPSRSKVAKSSYSSRYSNCYCWFMRGLRMEEDWWEGVGREDVLRLLILYYNRACQLSPYLSTATGSSVPPSPPRLALGQKKAQEGLVQLPQSCLVKNKSPPEGQGLEQQPPVSPRLPPPARAVYHNKEADFNYNDVCVVVERMLASGLGEKNLLFGYSNPQMKEWAALQKYMQKNSLNLLSVAKFIEQALKFDLYL